MAETSEMVERVAEALRTYEIAPGHTLQRAVADAAYGQIPRDRLDETIEAVFYGMAASAMTAHASALAETEVARFRAEVVERQQRIRAGARRAPKVFKL